MHDFNSLAFIKPRGSYTTVRPFTEMTTQSMWFYLAISAIRHLNSIHSLTWSQWLTHKSSRVGDVGADLAIDLDEPLHADLLDLVSGQRVLEPVPQEDDEGQALPQLVGTGGGPRSLSETQNTTRSEPAHITHRISSMWTNGVTWGWTPLTNTPVSLSSIQCLGAATRFKCFFGPRA